MGVLKQIGKEAWKATKGIALQKNVVAAAPGGPMAVGAVLAGNTANYAAKNASRIKIKGVSSASIGKVASRLNDVRQGKTQILNKGDIHIAAKYAAHKAVNHVFKGKQNAQAHGIVNGISNEIKKPTLDTQAKRAGAVAAVGNRVADKYFKNQQRAAVKSIVAAGVKKVR